MSKKVDEIARDSRGRITRGGGRNPRLTPEAASLVWASRTYTQEAVSVIVRLMRSSRRDDIKLASAKYLLERGHGAVPQALKLSVDNVQSVPMDLTRLDPAERLKLWEMVQRTRLGDAGDGAGREYAGVIEAQLRASEATGETNVTAASSPSAPVLAPSGEQEEKP